MATDIKGKRREGTTPIQMRSVSVLQSAYTSLEKVEVMLLDRFRQSFLYSSLQNFELNFFHRIRLASPIYTPLLICLAALPFLILLSLYAGWSVWRSVPTGWQTQLFLQYGDGGPPYSTILLPELAIWQPYDVYLHLVLPVTDSNFALGNFMAKLSINTTDSNEMQYHASKSAFLLPPSRGILMRLPKTMTMVIPMIYNFMADESYLQAHVQLGRLDGWKSLGHGEGRELSVISASLRGVVRPKGLRRLIHMFPTSVAIASAVAFFVTSLIMLACCLIPTIGWGSAEEGDLTGLALANDNGPDVVPKRSLSSQREISEEDEDFKMAEEEPQFRRRTSRRRTSSMKLEEED